MLADEVKDLIQSSYRQLLKSRDLIPRYGQRQMIAEIAKQLAVINPDKAEAGYDDAVTGPVCVIEAGTGTGKTLAYLLATIPLAQALKLKVVIATATVALQEQVMLKDIPELQEGSDFHFSVALAKGRGRYLCLSKLDGLLEPNESLQAMMDLYGDDPGSYCEPDSSLYQEMLDALIDGSWEGDRDDWKRPLSDQDWRPLTVDNAQCLGVRCSNFRQCYFFKARDSLDNADVIVSNHDLVLSDLALGGGAILPEPEQCIYIFDEAHHLPVKSNNHFEVNTRIRATRGWLERSGDLLGQLLSDGFIVARTTEQYTGLQESLLRRLEDTWLLLQPLFQGQGDFHDNRSRFTFPLGVIPPEIQDVAGNQLADFSRLAALLSGIADELKIELEEASDLDRKQQAEQFFPRVGSAARRAEATAALWYSYTHADNPSSPPTARWMVHFEDDSQTEMLLSASPVLAAENLKEKLWERCAGAVLTSATLSALGSFELLTLRAGLPEATFYLSIPSPFDFGNAATLSIPKLSCEPSDTEKHTEVIVNALPQLLEEPIAALMLFSSRRQMQDVMQRLPDDIADLVLCQDDYQKSQLLKYHRQRVEQEEGSLIFGLASFAEGVDLPGKYCTHVLIAKIPFAVPNDPIETTLADWVEQQGKNPFITLAVPDAAFRLVQASGRLLRSETDSGRITLFDERIVTKRYGKQILASLPPYRQEVFAESFIAD